MSERNAQPDWLTKNYVLKILRKYYNDSELLVNDMVVKPATPIGENYASIMLRVAVEMINSKNENSNITFLVKISFSGKVDHFTQYNIYTREMDMYEFVLPKMAEILKEIGINGDIFAQTIYVDRANNAILFEDLKVKNFTTADRIDRLDLTHVKLTLDKLAKFHAAAAILNERSPDIFAKNFDRGLFNKHTDDFAPIMLSLLDALTRNIGKDATLKEKYEEKLKALSKNFMNYGKRAFEVKEGNFVTLIHGDLWTTNMMFRYDNANQPLEVVPIDYQLSTWTSPTIDLHYLFHTSLREEQRLNQQAELLQYYYYRLVNILRSLKYQGHIPTLHKFSLEFEAHAFIAILGAFIFQPLMIYNGTEESTIENLTSKSKEGIRLRDSYYENKTVEKYVHALLPIFDQKGLLDKMY